MPEAQKKKAYRRVVRNDNGVGLRVAYFDAQTGAEITDLTGYIVIDQGTDFLSNPDGSGGGDSDSGSDNNNDNEGSGSSGNSDEDGNQYWRDWYDNPNVSKGSGDIIGDLQKALHTAQDIKRDIPIHLQGEKDRFFGVPVDPIGIGSPQYRELDQFKTGATEEAIPTPNVTPRVEPVGSSTGNTGPWSYDSTVGSQPVQSSGPTLMEDVRADLTRVLGTPINEFMAGGDPVKLKANIFNMLDKVPIENLVSIAKVVAPPEQMAVLNSTLKIPGIGEKLVRGQFAEQIWAGIDPAKDGGRAIQQIQQGSSVLDSQIQQASVSPRTDTNGAPVPANKTERIKELQNAPNVQASVEVAKRGGSPLEVANAWLGYTEGDPKQAEALSQFFTKAGVNDPASGGALDPAKTAWCAAWLNGVLFESGIEGTGSATAKSFLDIGETMSSPTVGDIVVFDRGAVGSAAGHVGIIAGINPDGSLQVLGGNQGNSVSIKTYSTDRVEGYRRVSPTNVDQGVNEVRQASTTPLLPRGQTEGTYVNPKLASAMESLVKASGGKPFNQTTAPSESARTEAFEDFKGPIPSAPRRTEGYEDYVGELPKATSVFPQGYGYEDTASSNVVDDLTKAGYGGDTTTDKTAIEKAFESVQNKYTGAESPSELQNSALDAIAKASKKESTDQMSGPYSMNDKERERYVVQTVLGEAAGEGFEGMLAVANVIKNRSLSGQYPPDPKDVVLEGDGTQFSPWLPVSQGGNNPAARFPVGSPEYKKALAIVDGVFNSTLPDNTYGALNFHTTDSNPSWANALATQSTGPLEIGNHRFYPMKEQDSLAQAYAAPIPAPRPTVEGAKSTFMKSMNNQQAQPAPNVPNSGFSSRDSVSQRTSGEAFASLPSVSQPKGTPSNSTLDSFSGSSSKSSSSSYLDQPSMSQPKGTPSNSTLDSFSGSSSKSSSSSGGGDWYSTNGTASQKAAVSKSTPSNSTLNSFMTGPSKPKTTTTLKTQPKSGPSFGSPAPTTKKATTPRPVPSNSTLNSFM